MRIIVSGSIAYDRIMDFRGRFKDHIIPTKLHILNVSFYIQQLRQSYGGTAGNIAYNLAGLGEKPILVATHGNDFGEYANWCRKNKIITQYSKKVSNQPTSTVYIITDLDDNQIAGFFPGAMLKSNGRLDAKMLKHSSYAIVSPGNLKDMMEYPKFLKKAQVPFIFDPGQQITSLSKTSLLSGLTLADIFISNDYEYQMVKKKTKLNDRTFLKKAGVIITTKGGHGSVIKTKNNIYKIPAAKPQKIKDPTGAGDAYRAGILKGLAMGLGWEQTGRLAATVAVYAVEKYGTQAHKLSWQKVRKRYRQNFKDTV